jgi:hypothetical protein
MMQAKFGMTDEQVEAIVHQMDEERRLAETHKHE